MTISEERSSSTKPPLAGNQYFHLKELKQKEDSFRMLAQQRMPVHIEYLQPHLSVPESKASPLALLAATCSSIGKPESEKKDIKTSISTLSNSKLRDGGKKSLFEPYQSDKKVRDVPSPPSITQTSSVVSSKSSIMSAYEGTKAHTSRPTELENGKDIKDKFHQPNLRCMPISPPFPPLPTRVPAMPIGHHHMSPDHCHGECSQCKQHRPHSEPISLGRPPLPPMGGPCGCAMCVRNDSKCHFQQGKPPMSNLYPPPPSHYKPIPSMMNPCRDPNCTNCSSKSTNSLQNFLHPALIHQCTHGSLPQKPIFPPPPLPTHSSSHEHLSKTNSKSFVCNWVSEGKHCGSSYATSEDLFQHLRSHTNAQHQQQQECDTITGLSQAPLNGQNVCKIHGCPCNSSNARKSSPRVNAPAFSYGHLPSNNLRYTPYQRPPPSVSAPFNYPPHAFHY